MNIQHGTTTYRLFGEPLVEIINRGARLGQRGGAVPKVASDAAPASLSRIGPKGPGPDASQAGLLRELARVMVGRGLVSLDERLPMAHAGLGHFVRHDLMLAPAVWRIAAQARGMATLLPMRSPALDLDGLYGLGPEQPDASRRYQGDGVHLRPRRGAAAGCNTTAAAERIRRALIHFHNRVVDEWVPASLPPPMRFLHARETVTLHYQWALRHDHLPRLIEPALLDLLWQQRGQVDPPATRRLGMPIEFATVARCCWGTAARPGLRKPWPLSWLTRRVGEWRPDGEAFASQAHAMLIEGRAQQVATGQQMARLFGVTPLSVPAILIGSGGADLSNLSAAELKALTERTPLWFYILREIELNEGRLGQVGATIMTEVVHRAMASARFSMLARPAWRPSLGNREGSFTVSDLFAYACNGSPQVLDLFAD